MYMRVTSKICNNNVIQPACSIYVEVILMTEIFFARLRDQYAPPAFSDSFSLKNIYEKSHFHDRLVLTEGLTTEIKLCLSLKGEGQKILLNKKLFSLYNELKKPLAEINS